MQAKEGEKEMKQKERELAGAEESRGGHLLQSCFSLLFKENNSNKFVIQEEVETADASLGGAFLSTAPCCAISASFVSVGEAAPSPAVVCTIGTLSSRFLQTLKFLKPWKFSYLSLGILLNTIFT